MVAKGISGCLNPVGLPRRCNTTLGLLQDCSQVQNAMPGPSRCALPLPFTFRLLIPLPCPQDRDGKMAYLQKIFDTVSLATGQAVVASPAKVVAGLEPEATNAFLQLLGMAAQAGNGAAAVQVRCSPGLSSQ